MKTDVLIVGGGLMGFSTALQLAMRDTCDPQKFMPPSSPVDIRDVIHPGNPLYRVNFVRELCMACACIIIA